MLNKKGRGNIGFNISSINIQQVCIMPFYIEPVSFFIGGSWDWRKGYNKTAGLYKIHYVILATN